MNPTEDISIAANAASTPHGFTWLMSASSITATPIAPSPAPSRERSCGRAERIGQPSSIITPADRAIIGAARLEGSSWADR